MSYMKLKWESQRTPAQTRAACERARVLNEVQAVIRMIESQMVEAFGYYNIPQPDGSLRYYASLSDAEWARRLAAEREARKRLRLGRAS